MPTHIQIKRVYDAPGDGDGYRILVDRLWPRGVKKESLPMDRWCKELAPSTELRQWFDHRADRLALFTDKYRAELEERRSHAVDVLAEAQGRAITLLYAAKNPACNHAMILKAFLEELDV